MAQDLDLSCRRHGAEHMPEILRSFREKGASSPYFQDLYNDFMNLRATKGTEDNLHKEWDLKSSEGVDGEGTEAPAGSGIILMGGGERDRPKRR